MCRLGLPGWTYVTTSDPDERSLLKLMLAGAVETEEELMKARAVHIANAVGELFKQK